MTVRITFLIALLIHTFAAYIPIASNSGFTVKIIARFKIDSALFPKILTLVEKHDRFVQLSRGRALYFKSMAATPETLKPSVLRIYTSLEIGQIIGGTTPYSLYLLLDSGSDDTWFQCDGRLSCFPLSGGNFNYHKSQTYTTVSCDHPLCNPKICSENLCLYIIRYVGGATTRGILTAENFTFPDNDGFISFKNVVFGCGFDYQNIMFGGPVGPFNPLAGIFGIGAGPRSLPTQLAPATNLRFSYRLVSWTVQETRSSYLHFGNDAQLSEDIKTMQLLPQGLPRYYVRCTGISLNGNLLSVDPSLWALKPDGSGGFAFDRGSGPTFFIKSAYNVVKAWISGYFERHGKYPITGQRLPI